MSLAGNGDVGSADGSSTFADNIAGVYQRIKGSPDECRKKMTIEYTVFRPLYSELVGCESEVRVLPDLYFCNPNTVAENPTFERDTHAGLISLETGRTSVNSLRAGSKDFGLELVRRDDGILVYNKIRESGTSSCEYKKTKTRRKQFYDIRTGVSSPR